MLPLDFWLLLLIPIVGSAICYRRARHVPFALVLALLIPPFVGELLFALESFKLRGEAFPLGDPSVWRAMVYLYPFVLVPLGLWSPLVGLVAWLMLERTAPGNRANIWKSAPFGMAIGGLIGASLLGGYYAVLSVLGISHENLTLWAVIGAASGATGGFIVALFLWRNGLVQDPPLNANRTTGRRFA